MKIPKFVQTLGQIDDDLIAASAAPAPVRAVKRPWVKWTVLAASLAFVILAGAIALPMMLPDDALPEGYYPTGKVISFGDMKRHYKYASVQGTESAIEWPNEYQTVQEKHR